MLFEALEYAQGALARNLEALAQGKVYAMLAWHVEFFGVETQ